MKPFPGLIAALSIAAGLAAALAHPPFGFLPGLLAYGAIMLLVERARGPWGGFFRGWLAGTAYFTVGCWWVYEAFQVDAATYGWMAPFAVAGLAGGLGVIWGIIGALYRLVKPSGPFRVVVFAGLFTAMEWVRGHLFTGFPWNLPGESFAAGGLLSQGAAVFGVYGLTWLAIFAASAPALLVFERRLGGWINTAAAVLIVAGLALFGAHRLALDPAPKGPPITVRIAQPNYSELPYYDEATYQRMLATYLELTTRPTTLAAPPQIVFWPEGALPKSLDELLAPQAPERAAITSALQPGQILVLSSWRRDGTPQNPRLFNSLAVLQRAADGLELIGLYDKHRLVLFGEYTPHWMRAVGVGTLVPAPGSFELGPPPRPLDLGLAVIQPLICYESLFPGYVRASERRSRRRVDLIANLSNDGWFGVTSGPLQHLNLARYRAIEEGVMMVRSTPGGVSAAIDSRGRIAPGNALQLGESGVIDAQMNNVQFETVYQRFGDLVCGLLLVLSLLALWGMKVVRKLSA